MQQAQPENRMTGSIFCWQRARLALQILGSTFALALASNSLHAATFDELCKQSGVTKCVGFNTSSEISPYVTAGNGAVPTLDTGTKASGAGSMKMTYVSGGTQATGMWKSDIGGPMKPGTHFYFTFKSRLDSNILSAGGTSNGWKQFILYTAPNDPSCNQTQIVMEKHIQGFPIAYSKCGALPFRDELSSGDIQFQFGDFSNCTYRSTSGCWKYVANKWVTYYFDVDFKAYGTASRVKAWLSVEGGEWQQWMDFDPTFGQEGSSQFETIQLTMYTTGGANGSGNAWYDDFIVSKQPIFDLASSPGTSPPVTDVKPSPPTSVRVQ
jgi:hypothetical protein